MQNRKKPYIRLISTVLIICMLISVLSQTSISVYSFSNSNDSSEVIKNPLLEENISIDLEENISLDIEYSSLKGRAKQELIVKYKDGSKSIDVKEKNRNANINELKSKERLDSTLELLEISSTDDISKVIDILEQDPNVEYVQPNYEVDIFTVNDAYIDLQWGIRNNGQSVNNIWGREGADINLLPILDVPTPNEIIVAVIDTGIEVSHEDLVENTDSKNGWNFVTGNNNVNDLSGHGTHISGIIGAGKNNIGVMGVAQNVKLLPLKVIENGVGYTSDVIEAIQYAEKMGAKIANCSFGSTYFNYAMYEAMRESNMLFVCAAGNTGTISNIYPASYELSNVLSVTSINNNGELASNASYGQYVDIAAPGVDIYSTTKNNSYTYGSGSSYAAAYVTGAAAKLLGARDMTAAQTISVLKQGATKKDNLTRYVKSGGILSISDSYDLIKDGQDIVIVSDEETDEYDESIAKILDDDNYFDLTAEEKEILLDYFRISQELLEECISSGYSLNISIKYAEKMGRFEFTLNEILKLYEAYNGIGEFDFEFDMLDMLISNCFVTIEDLNGVKQLMLSGYKAHNIIYAYIASKALDIPLQTIIKKDQNISTNGYTSINNTDFTDDKKKEIWLFSINNWLDVNVLINYMTGNNLTYDELVHKVRSYENNIIFPLNGETPEKYPNGPFSYRRNTKEKVNLNTGSIIYESMDVVLPGKNGMDLVITSRYDSNKANIHDTYVDTTYADEDPTYTDDGTPIYTPIYSTQLKQANYDLQNNLGIGWSFGFSYIEMTDGHKYLHLSDGTVYTISSTFSLLSSNLEKYPLMDIQILPDNGTFSNGEMNSYYVLKHKNGINEYFSWDGRLLGQKDRFGNKIKFEHTLSTSGKYLIAKITDTLNRTVTISYIGTPLGRDVVITLPDNGKITYVLEKIPGYYGTTYRLVQKKDQLNTITSFAYSIGLVSEKLISESTNSANKHYVNLNKVTYPTGASTEYTYSVRNESIGTGGSTQMYKISQRLDKQLSYAYNVETYAYSGTHTAYPHASMDTAPSGYTYSTVVSNSTTGKIIINTFDKQNLKTNAVTYNSSNEKLLEYIYDYNSNKQMIRSYERTYANNGSTYHQAVNTYTYDIKNNITGYWTPLAGLNTTSTEYKTTYTYNATYNYIRSKQYKQNSTTTVTEEYTPSSDSKTVTWKKIYETNGTNEREIKEATQYLYDSYGNVREERRYYGDLTTLNTYIATKYEYIYNSDGTSTMTITTENVKDADGQLTGSGDGVVTQKKEYDKMGRISTSADGKGYTTTYLYDLVGRQTRVTNPDDTYKTYSYDDTANTLTETNEKNTVMKYIYDGFGNITSVRDMESGTDIIVFTYDAEFRVKEESTLSASSESGSKTVYTYDYLDRVVTKTMANASNVMLSKDTYTYDANTSHEMVAHTVVGDANSPSITTTVYTDSAGRIVKQGYYIETTEYTDEYTYDYVGNRLTVQTARTKSLVNGANLYDNKWEYDYANRVTREYDIYGKYSSSTYNALGQKTSFKDPKANETGVAATTYEYDAFGRLTMQTTPFDGTAVSKAKYYYDNNSNITKKKVSSNTVGASEQYRTIGYEYNNRNKLTKVINYDINGIEASYVQYYYDAVGNTVRMYTGLSTPLTISGLDNVSGTTNYNVTKYEYDRHGKVTKLTDPMNYEERYTYDLLGNMLTKTDRNGKEFTYTYDGLSRLRKTMSGETILEEYTYTLTGKRRADGNGTVTTTNTYDSVGRLTKAEDKNNATQVVTTKEYTYDVGLNKLSTTVKVGSTTTNQTLYTYDEASRMTTVKENGTLQCTYSYDVNGNRSSLVYTNGVTTEYTYNHANMLKSLANKKGTTTLSSYTYAYQLDGNEISKTDNSGKVTSYVYDGLGRLTSESEKVGSTVTFSLSYQYDASNNRTSMTAKDGTVTEYSYDKNNRLTSTSETIGTTVTKTTYTYDRNGNTISKMKDMTAQSSGGSSSASIGKTSSNAEVYKYDVLNRMIYSNTERGTTTYKYRADGLRYSKTSDGSETEHIWDGRNIVGDVVNGTVSATYVRGIGLIASKSGSTLTYHVYNGHGDVVQLTSSSGAVTKTYEYDAFGNEKVTDVNDSNPFRYCGEYYDKETNTIYLRARYYDPRVGRFTQQDVWDYMNPDDPLSLNLYTYAHNNPIMYQDPSGHWIETIIDVGGLIWSVADMWIDPSWINAGFLLWDVASIVIPFAPGSYIAKGAKLVGKIDDVVDATKAINKMDDLSDVAKLVNKADDVTDAAKDVEKIVDGAKMSTNQALDVAQDFLDKGYKDMGGGRFVSADGTKQIRIGDSDILGKHGNGPHINFETLASNPNKPGKMTVVDNKHVYLTD